MITIRASAALDALFEAAIRESTLCTPENHCTLTRQDPEAVASEKRLLVVLNLSSYTFRIVVLFEYRTDAAAIAQLARATRHAGNRLEGQALHDACAELANMICGAANRQLGQQFRHVGMSTPFILEDSCAQYVSILHPALTQTLSVQIDGQECFRLTVCTCTPPHATLDFAFETAGSSNTGSGELELF